MISVRTATLHINVASGGLVVTREVPVTTTVEATKTALHAFKVMLVVVSTQMVPQHYVLMQLLVLFLTLE